MDTEITLVLGNDDSGRRADRILRKVYKNVPLSLIYQLFRKGKIRCAGKALKASDRCAAGDILQIDFSDLENSDNFSPHERNIFIPKSKEFQANKKFNVAFSHDEDLPHILWQNNHLAAVFKPAGLKTHDGIESLDFWFRQQMADKIEPSASFSPGPLHRLDRNTSGIIMFSKTRLGAEKFSEALRLRKVKKIYAALLEGYLEKQIYLLHYLKRDNNTLRSTVDARSEGKLARMFLAPMLQSNGYTLAGIDLQTGFTHQIRAQAAAAGYPLAGDIKYGAKKNKSLPYFLLHATLLYLEIPLFEDMPNIIEAPFPKKLMKSLSQLLHLSLQDIEKSYDMLRVMAQYSHQLQKEGGGNATDNF